MPATTILTAINCRNVIISDMMDFTKCGGILCTPVANVTTRCLNPTFFISNTFYINAATTKFDGQIVLVLVCRVLAVYPAPRRCMSVLRPQLSQDFPTALQLPHGCCCCCCCCCSCCCTTHCPFLSLDRIVMLSTRLEFIHKQSMNNEQ
jgi:hypothetical protein